MVDSKKLAVVISRFEEDISWAAVIPENERLIYNKGDTDSGMSEHWLPNEGRESHTYFHYIHKCYHNLPDEVIFCQGKPFDHAREFLEHIKDPSIRTYGAILGCDPFGLPQCDWTDLHSFCKVLLLPVLPHYKFVQGAQFRVTREQIQLRSREFYESALALTKIDGNKSPWVFERLFPTIFGLDL